MTTIALVSHDLLRKLRGAVGHLAQLLFAVMTIVVGLKAAAAAVDGMILLADQSSDLDVAAGSNFTRAIELFLVSTTFFILAGALALVRRRPYFGVNAQGIGYVVAAFCSWQLASIALVFWVRSQQMGIAINGVGIFVGLVGFISISKGSRWFATGKQCMASSVEVVLQKDRRPPILFLRSFEADDSAAPMNYSFVSRERNLLMWRVLNPQFWTERREWSFEEVLCRAITAVGPVIAIGRPGERLPRLGAARKYVRDSLWRKEVIAMIDRSQFVCLLVGGSLNLLWEYEQLVRLGDESKLVLLVPPDGGYSQTWTEFVDSVASLGLNHSLPKDLPDQALAIIFKKPWNPVTITGHPTFGNYHRIAIEAASA